VNRQPTILGCTIVGAVLVVLAVIGFCALSGWLDANDRALLGGDTTEGQP